MRHYVALYVGGMGSRKQNFYNALVQRYGFEEAAQTVQDLYLEGRKDEAAAALPGELIDTVALVGPADRVRERIAVYRDAGVGTLMISPMAWTFEDRLAQLRAVAELAGVSLPADCASGRWSRTTPRRWSRWCAPATRRTWSGRRPAGQPPTVSPGWAERFLAPDRWAHVVVDRTGALVAAVAFRPAHVAAGSRPGRRTAAAGRRASLDPVRAPVALARGDRRRAARRGRGGDGRARLRARACCGRPRARPPSASTPRAGWERDGRRAWHPWVGLTVVGYARDLT